MKLGPQWIRLAPSTKMDALIPTRNSQHRIIEGAGETCVWNKSSKGLGLLLAEGRGRGEREEEDRRGRASSLDPASRKLSVALPEP